MHSCWSGRGWGVARTLVCRQLLSDRHHLSANTVTHALRSASDHIIVPATGAHLHLQVKSS